MSAVSERTKTTTRHEYYVPAPACWTDISMAMTWAANARTAAGLDNSFDDVIKVDHEDENIIVYWEETK